MMHTLGALLDSAVYDIGHSKSDPDYLRNHPGRGRDMVRNGAWRLRHHPQIANAEQGKLEAVHEAIAANYETAQQWCESPIEREMLAALLTANWDQCGDPAIPVVHPAEAFIPDRKPVVILPQFQIGRHRVDFAILCRGMKSPSIVVVECDGAAFHDAQKDRERDAYLRALGIHVFRATGSVISRDAEGVSNLIVSLVQDRI